MLSLDWTPTVLTDLQLLGTGRTKETLNRRNVSRQQVNQVSVNPREDSSSDGLTVCHALSVGRQSERTQSWIVDCGATSHIRNDVSQFSCLTTLEKPMYVVLGDNSSITTTREGEVELMLELEKGREGVYCVMSYSYLK